MIIVLNNMKDNMIYDIRNAESSAKTLDDFTAINSDIWKNEYGKLNNRFEDSIECMDYFIKKYDGHYPCFDDIRILCTHLTTSNSGCKSILENGILDLQKCYMNKDSELRQFLDSKGIIINIENCKLLYKGHEYCISKDKNNYSKGRQVGIKFYYDYAVCGFLFLDEDDIYDGDVHLRPEILKDIDVMLKTQLSREWKESHSAYEILFTVLLSDVINDDCNDENGEIIIKKVLVKYLLNAYYRLVENYINYKYVICKNGVIIGPNNICLYRPFELWDTNYQI